MRFSESSGLDFTAGIRMNAPSAVAMTVVAKYLSSTSGASIGAAIRASAGATGGVFAASWTFGAPASHAIARGISQRIQDGTSLRPS